MPNQNTFLYPPLTFRILAVAILACLFLVPKTMADTKDQEYIVLISSSTFREKWAYDLLETVEKAFNEENSVKVYSETLTTWHFNNQQEIDQKVDYLKDKYSVPPQAVIFVGDPGWYVCKPLFDTIWRGVPTIICHSMPHTPADINKYYDGEYIPDDKGVALEHFLENAVYYDVQPSFIQKNIIYVVIVLGTAIVLLLFYFMHKRIKKVRETEWQEHLHLLENILDNLPIAAKVKDVDNDMRYTFINKKAEELFEYPAKEAIGRTDFDIMPEAATMIRKEDEELVRTGIAQFGTRRFFTNKNEERFTFQNNNIVSFSNGRKWILYTAWDITDQKILERKLRLAKEEAEESNRIKSAFLANMSHEIRTPLNAIVGFSSILAEDVSEEERTEYLSIISKNNDILLQLINDILDLSKIEAGTLEYVYANIDVNKMLSEIEQAARMRQTNANVAICAVTPLEGLLLYTDQRRVTQVLNNFISNAMKFTNTGSITFGYEEPKDGYIRFFVTDTGTGIPPEKVADIFNRFVKLDSFKQGTGLGLAISQNIVKELKGEIGVASELGKGSTFWFTLPYKPAVKEDKKQMPKDIQPVSIERNKLTILVAEDNASNYKLFESILKYDYHLIHAWDGMEAVEMFREHNPQIVLMDINMPVMDGYEATREIRKYSAKIPIIAVTAFAYASDEQKVMESGFDGYMPKPINARLLKAQLMDIMQKRIILL